MQPTHLSVALCCAQSVLPWKPIIVTRVTTHTLFLQRNVSFHPRDTPHPRGLLSRLNNDLLSHFHPITTTHKVTGQYLLQLELLFDFFVLLLIGYIFLFRHHVFGFLCSPPYAFPGAVGCWLRPSETPPAPPPPRFLAIGAKPTMAFRYSFSLSLSPTCRPLLEAPLQLPLQSVFLPLHLSPQLRPSPSCCFSFPSVQLCSRSLFVSPNDTTLGRRHRQYLNSVVLHACRAV